MKLHLGCGEKHIDGFVNVDIRNNVGADIVEDIFSLKTFKPESVELIYASHVLEHLDRARAIEALKRWYEILIPSGILRIAVPDMDKVFRRYIWTQNLTELRGFIWGGQTYPENYHYSGWTYRTLSNDLLMIGFSNVSTYDWRYTEHAHIDDYSQAYLPHMDKEHGELMSLNVEATK